MQQFNNAVKQEQYRQRVIDCLVDEFGPMVFNERQLFTLGGPQVDDDGNLVEGAELHHLHRVGLFDKRREGNYISVEKDKDVHARNLKYQGPVWELGTFKSVWFRYSQMPDFYPAMVHADLMTGIQAAKPTIFSVLENPPYLPVQRLYNSWRARSQCVLFVVNVLKANTWVKALGNKLNNRPRHSLERMARFQAIRERIGVDLVDSFSYESTRCSKMHTLVYRLAPR